ncbi:MAG TPA: GGDEF domain-containing protein [Pseudoxanthomonas sp.]|nr:GGDEF domain-containing protein [Pseudoxanthomonas sp.]
MIEKLKSDSQLRLITLLGLTTAFTVALFSVYRLWRGEWLAVAADLGVVALLVSPVVYALRTGNTRGSGLFMCAANSAACWLCCWVIGPTASQWLYLVLMTNFFIATPLPALIANVLLTIALLLMPHLFGSGLQRVAVAVTAVLVTLFAYLFAIRVRKDRDRLELAASLDALTGVPNRRTMEHALTAAVERQRRGEGRYGLVIMDLDHFKEVNDTYGHSAGDSAIADLAAILKFEMRRNDEVFRFGGEEFVVLVAVENRDELQAVAERLRLAVRGALRGPGGRITVSLGAALLGEEDRWQEWFLRADEALYRAKNNGRDSCAVSEA